MRSLRFVVTAAVVLSTSALPLAAGDYHSGSTLICSDCHTMHYSQSHGYTGDLGTQFSGGPYQMLLRTQANDLCLSCHDGMVDVPDVVGMDSSSTSVREAGALQDISGTPDYQTWTGHTLGSTDIAPGGTWSNTSGLSCVDCHDPHGNTNGGVDVAGNPVTSAWRNLKTMTSGGIAVSYSVGTNDLTTDIFETSAAGANHYDVNNVNLNEPSASKSGMAEFCKQCHQDFHGDVGDTLTIGGNVVGTSAVALLRHPSAGVNIGGVGDLIHSLWDLFLTQGKTNFVKVMAGDGLWGTEASQGTPTCLTCHKAHGNRNPFGLIYMAGSGTLTEEGDSGTSMADTCKQCHPQGA